VIAAEAERFPVDRVGEPAERAKYAIFAVEADQAMAREIVGVTRRSVALEIAPVRVEADLDVADPSRDQRLLGRAGHAHGDVGVAPQQVFVAIADREFDGDMGMGAAIARQHERQHFAADDLARRDAHDALVG